MKQNVINIELLWLLEKQAPDHKAIADFRKNNKQAIKEIFKDFVRLCKELNLFCKEIVVFYGSNFKGSKYKKSNYSIKKLELHKKYIEEKIDFCLEELSEATNYKKRTVSRSPMRLKK